MECVQANKLAGLAVLSCERNGYSNNLKATEIAKVRPGRPIQVDECPSKQQGLQLYNNLTEDSLNSGR